MCSLLLFKYILGLMFYAHFPAFGLYTEKCGESFRIQSQRGKILTKKRSEYGHFSRSEICFFKVFTVSLRRIEEKIEKIRKNGETSTSKTTSKTVSLLFKSFLQYI